MHNETLKKVWPFITFEEAPYAECHGPCMIWTGGKNKHGYGQVKSVETGKIVYVHRIIFEYYSGLSLGPRDFICHSCDNPACFSYAHLSLGDYKSNAADRVSRRRRAYKLDAAKVKEIRALADNGLSHAKIAEIFEVSRPCVSKVIKKETWNHV